MQCLISNSMHNSYNSTHLIYRYIVDCISKEEALEMLRKNLPFKAEREERIKKEGYPAYTTAVSSLFPYYY